jgi:glycosyltransferase involved in cell wall biosynthesis
VTSFTRRPAILVTHPGRQHSHQAALGLAEAGLLAGYWSGVPADAGSFRRVPAALRSRFVRYAPVPLDPRRTRWFPWTPALRRSGDALLPSRLAAWTDLAACRLFDRWAARRLPGSGASAVIACEISALATFRTAGQRGIAKLLDAPSIHHAAQDQLHGTTDSPALHRRIVAVKDAEIALADHILTVSELARETYLAAGIPAAKVHALPLGADLELFSLGEARPADTDFVFLFSGATIHRKGFDLLLQAFDRVRAEHPGVRLRLVGPRGDASHLLDRRGTDGIDVLGAIPQPELAAELRRADLLVLPSRNDSYGMVVAEALASGVPALVSEMVGAKELIAPGKTGWIVPVGDAAALAGRMAWCAGHPDAVRALRGECRRAAESATWGAYRRRLAAWMQETLGKTPMEDER